MTAVIVTLCATGAICRPPSAVTTADLIPPALLLAGLAVLLLSLRRSEDRP